jgi:hypothetical protein
LFPQQGVTPGLSATVDDECFQTAGTPPDNLGPAARVLKGYRGNYLAGATPNGFFRDGWGNVGTPLQASPDPHDESRNFGWWVKNEGDTLTIKSLGADNAVDDDTPPALEAEVDQPITIDKADWRIPLDGWQVRLANSSDADLAIADIDSGTSNFDNLGVTLLVFENVGASGKWRQYRSTRNTCNTSTLSLSPEGVCVFMFVADEDGKIPCGASGKTPADVPLGRHILALTANHGLPNHGLPSARQFVTPVDFYPGAIPPEITWNIRKPPSTPSDPGGEGSDE